MESQDRQAIDGLFNRLDDVDRRSPPKDAEADALIRERVTANPNAPYLMAQTIVMQDHALNQAQQRIEELERQASERPAGGGGFLSGLFGGGSQASRPEPTPYNAPGRSALGSPMGAPMGAPTGAPTGGAAGSPWQGAAGQAAAAQPGRGGGFLAGAAQTAMGVAGGVLIGSAIGSMFGGGGQAQAAETPAAAPAETPAAEPAAEPAADDSGGGVFDSFFGGDDEAI
ncbi:DUF2076 domain-containing protein [Methylopila turkensis]|uniref:ABC transporter substrate-binding protein n=1 Tax=Methylopila turkensis TaxID=1437816 RepID=A0A9W6N5J8_9HYPH|nr:DUF2076 domain-containing protein [Methylopila turkensis]GLK78312.1 ABC transporter substrate-binding protein [Methylopila turkensis]